MDAEARPEDLLAHAAWIRALARGLVRDPDVADDLVQDTWLVALRRRPRSDRPLRPWLARVAKNFARQRARHEQAGPRRALGDATELAQLPQLPTGEALAERAELQSKLVRCVLDLREPYRSTVLLRYYEDLPAVEIARRLGLPDATVRSQLSRALRELRTRLDQEHEGGCRAWSLAFAPLIAEPAVVAFSFFQGVMVMKASVKTSVAIGLLLLISVSGWGVWKAVWPGGKEPRAAESEVALQAPVVEVETPRAGEATAPARVPVREVVALAAPESILRAAWSARLVDARTKEPLPEFQFGLRQGELSEDLETDSDGRVVSKIKLVAGELQLTFVDHPEVPRRVVLDKGRGVARIEEDSQSSFDPQLETEDVVPVEVGPTYHIDFSEPAQDLEELTATILTDDDGWTNYLRQIQSAPLRGVAAPWVRFAGLATGILPKRGPWTLEVTSEDGLWLGRTDVDSIEGVYPVPVPMRLEAHGRVDGVVTNSLGAPIVAAAVQLALLDESEDRRLPFGNTRDDGAFSLEWVLPGRYALTVTDPGHVAFRTEIDVRRLEPVPVDVVLESLPDGGAIRGKLSSRTGTYETPVLVRLRASGSDRPQMHGEVKWSEQNGRRVGTFAFEKVPQGEYELSIHSFMDKFAWTPPTMTVRPPIEGLEFICQDDVATRNIAFKVLDSETGEPIDQYFKLLSSTNAGSMSGLGGLSSSAIHLVGVPAEGRLDWAIAADGFATFFGDETYFEGEHSYVDPSGGVLAEVRLDRGWSQRVRVLNSETREPIAGVEVVIDGESVATTDENGEAHLKRDAAPASTELRHAAWKPADPEKADPFGFGAYRLWHQVLLSPR